MSAARKRLELVQDTAVACYIGRVNNVSSRPSIAVPAELMPLVSRMCDALHPIDIWLFGSRARGDHRPDSDWDVLVVLADDAPEELSDPLVTWQMAKDSRVPAHVLSTRHGDLESIWGLPNTLGYDLAREGVRLVVG